MKWTLNTRRYATLHISSSAVRLLSVRGTHVELWDSVALDEGLVKDGLIIDPKAVGAAINALFRLTKVPKTKVIVAVTGLPFTYRILEMPVVGPDMMEEAVTSAASAEMPLPVDQTHLSWAETETNGERSKLFVLGMYHNLVDAVTATLREAGVKQWVMDLKPLALARAAGRRNAIIASVEPDFLDIVLVVDGAVSLINSLSPQWDDRSPEKNITYLVEEISKAIRYYQSTNPERPFDSESPILLTGELAGAEEVSGLVQAEVPYPVETLVCDINRGLGLPWSLYSVNVGLALKRTSLQTATTEETTHFRDIDVDVFRGRYDEQPQTLSLAYAAVPAVLALTAGLLMPWSSAKTEVSAETILLQSELNAVQQELVQARQSIDSATEELAQTESRLGEVINELLELREEHRSITGGRTSTAETLSALERALPPTGTLDKVAVEGTDIQIWGEIETALAVLDFVAALEEEGFVNVRISELSEGGNEDEEEDSPVGFKIDITTQD